MKDRTEAIGAMQVRAGKSYCLIIIPTKRLLRFRAVRAAAWTSAGTIRAKYVALHLSSGGQYSPRSSAAPSPRKVPEPGRSSPVDIACEGPRFSRQREERP